MSHEIDTQGRIKGRMMYVGEVPWHGLGIGLSSPATSAEAIVYGGLDWPVSKEPLMVNTVDGIQTVENKFATIRTLTDAAGIQTQNILGVVGTSYKVLQNEDAFKFFDSIVAEGEAIYHTCGSLKGGRNIWLLAKLPDDIMIGHDAIGQYVLLTNGHDGLSTVQVKFTPIRVVCWNTLTAALKSHSTFEVNVRHTSKMAGLLDKAMKTIAQVRESAEQTKSDFELLASVGINRNEAENLFLALVPDNENAEKRNTRTVNIRLGLGELFDEGQNIDPENGRSVYGWYNAVTSYISHNRTFRSSDNDTKADNKFHSVMFGSGYALNQKALSIAMDYAKEKTA